MKEDFAGAKLPSGDFGENAAWWGIMILAMNLNAAMKRLVLKGPWIPKRMKALRFALINLPGRVLHHSRQLLVRLSACHPSFEILVMMRQRILSRYIGTPRDLPVEGGGKAFTHINTSEVQEHTISRGARWPHTSVRLTAAPCD